MQTKLEQNASPFAHVCMWFMGCMWGDDGCAMRGADNASKMAVGWTKIKCDAEA